MRRGVEEEERKERWKKVNSETKWKRGRERKEEKGEVKWKEERKGRRYEREEGRRK